MASINPYNGTLDKRLAKHLIRRSTFIYNHQFIQSFIGKTANQAVEDLCKAPDYPVTEPEDPIDGYWVNDPGLITYADIVEKYKKSYLITSWFLYNSLKDDTVHSKLTLFLHNQFTVSFFNRESEFCYSYVQLLRRYTEGRSLKELAVKMTLDNLMLLYLDNTRNFAQNPNENYAREFLELFTIGKGEQAGQGDYTTFTESDIVEVAKVLSGFVYDRDGLIKDPDTGLRTGFAYPTLHDSSDKTFSHRFNNQVIQGRNDENGMHEELNELVDMIYAKEATSTYLAKRLYRYFVSDNISAEIETDIITPLSQTLRETNFNIMEATKQLLKSEHFYDMDDSDNSDNIVGGLIKSPIQLLSEITDSFDCDLGDPNTDPARTYTDIFQDFFGGFYFGPVGMTPFMPIDVAGYGPYYQAPDYQLAWFNSSTMLTRYQVAEYMARPNRVVMPTYIDVIDFIENSPMFSDLSDPTKTVQELVDFIFPEPIPQERFDYFLNDILLDNNSVSTYQYLWTNYKAGDQNSTQVIKYQYEELLLKLLTSPEYQTF